MDDLDYMNEEKQKILAMETLNNRKNKTKFMNNIVIGIGIVICLIILLVLGLRHTSKVTGDISGNLKKIEKIYSSNSYQINEETIIYDDMNIDEENNLTIKSEIIKKDNNINIKTSLNDKESDEEKIFGVFFNNERFEIIINENDSIFLKYKDIYNVIKVYLPELEELCDDLSKISYLKYENEIKKLNNEFIKNYNLNSYYDLINEKLLSYIRNDNLKEELIIDNKSYQVEKYYIDISSREMIEIKIEMLKKLKDDLKIRKYVKSLNIVLLEVFEKSKDYENIKMTKDEFETFELKYANEFSNLYDKFIDNKISELETLYTKVSSDKNEKYILYIDEDGDVKKIEILSNMLINNNAVYVQDTKYFSKINEVKSKEVVPSNNVRLNLALLDRSDLYTSIEAVIERYNEIKKELSDKTKETIKNYFANIITK